MPTMRDIAKTAGVAIGTVSNYFNNSDLLAEDTRKVIQKAIQELDYHPNAAARSLKTNTTHRIGLVPLISLEDNYSPDPGDYAFLEFLSGVNTGSAELGYDLLLSTATGPAKELGIYKRLVREHQVDGLILMGVRDNDERVRFLSDLKAPFITYGRSNIDVDYAYVDVDGAAGLMAAVNYLVGLGHSRIAYITPPADLALTAQRWDGFVKAMKENNLPIVPELIQPGGFTEKDGQSAMFTLLELPEPPTAVLTANDLCAYGAIYALQARGRQVGKDVSVIGFDNIGFSAHSQPPLTTIAQPFRQIGMNCSSLLIQMINGQEKFPHKNISPHIIVRSTTGPVAIA
jgi:LacI family transcriptional regulator